MYKMRFEKSLIFFPDIERQRSKQNSHHDSSASSAYKETILDASRKHAYIILTPFNPTFIW